MNGTDWPSPAANLSTVEENIKKIVAATGVDVPSLVAGMYCFYENSHILSFIKPLENSILPFVFHD